MKTNAIWKRWRQHDRALDHSTLRIQNGGRALPDATMRTERFQNGYGVVVWTDENDTKTISVDANPFENGAKQLRLRLKTY